MAAPPTWHQNFHLRFHRRVTHNARKSAIRRFIPGTVNPYRRKDVLRILGISGRQLAGWEKAGLVAATDQYSFSELLQLTKVRDLRAKKVRPAVIRQSLVAIQKMVAGLENPLVEAGVMAVGSRVAFRHAGQSLEPMSGQFLMDFEPRAVVVPARLARSRNLRTAETAAEYFARGVALEEDPATQLDAINAYRKTLELEPRHAAAHINLGTLFYNRQDYVAAESHYRQAIAADPRYALAYFDLGNVLDETGRLDEAVSAYQSALTLSPTYADAHYNLALAFEKLKQPRAALRHWRAYVRLDSVGPWSVHARNQIERILGGEKLRLVRRGRGE